MTRKLKVDFFKVVLPDDFPNPFESILNAVNISPNDHTRNAIRNAYPFRLQKASQTGDSWTGEMIRIRMDQLPLKVKLSGDVSSIDLEDDEGIGEETAFLYHFPTKVLGIQRNRYGVSAGVFAWYFEEKGSVESIELQPILQKDGLQRLADMKVVRKMSLNIAGVENMTTFKGSGQGVESMLGLMNQFESPNLALTVSMGKQRGSLKWVKDFAQSFVQFNQQGESAIHKFEISGKTEDGEKSVIDLIEYRMVEEIEVELKSGRTLSSSEREYAVQEAFSSRKQELLEMFSGQ
ncbi:MAG: hypothetical protein OXI53_10480 [Nitrospira sp.]|nr:hypothetical protein [Nitrospira sp.]MDE0405726.1 hypothetical protein [Nitrospira sp.]MDE0485592.1 hypothetical protein [Nitrospira sp.]